MKLSSWRSLIPGLRIPKFPALGLGQTCVAALATGFGSGFLRPFSASWGSIVGFAYGLAWREIPELWLQWAVALAVLAVSVPIAGACSRWLGDPDPKCVVIDEIACVPLAIWPATGHALSWPQWLLVFVVYRLADLAKPFPARRIERLHGGWGIVLDDVVSATYMGAVWYLGLRFFSRG